MYPKWIQRDFDRGFRCMNCRGHLTTADIRMVGVRCPHPWSSKPLGMYLTLCPLCGHRTEYASDEPNVLDITNAIIAKSSQFERSPPAEKPVFTFDSPETEPPPEQEPTATPARVRPSRRPSQPLGPPTKAEIKRFLERLKKTSFKTNSKGFQKLTGPQKQKPLGPDDIKGPGEVD